MVQKQSQIHLPQLFSRVIFFARDCGLVLELLDVSVKNLVPQPLRASASAQEFMQLLPQLDDDLANQRQEVEAAGRYIYAGSKFGFVKT
ncbi:hypothetical protein DM860_000963 [Cuscuta australis]|uniref:Uncharacterized protein n=1 Tax=Cuscuta australis TaxID=267555 RepID=A0A328DX16_9ASTE|nr:hypothetical protein DM860_000963 [Cuscuta australis]